MRSEDKDRDDARAIDLRVPFVTILKILGAVLLVFALVRLWSLLVLLVFSLLLAIMLEPVVAGIERRWGRRWVGILCVALLPVIGTIAMTVPGVLLALTVSPLHAAGALAGYIAYHLIESYVIIPRVYGRQMRLSTLTVLLAVAIGGSLQGVVGAILILPLVAMYPAVERIWLSPWVGEETVEDHQRLERAPDVAAEEIVRGE